MPYAESIDREGNDTFYGQCMYHRWYGLCGSFQTIQLWRGKYHWAFMVQGTMFNSDTSSSCRKLEGLALSWLTNMVEVMDEEDHT